MFITFEGIEGSGKSTVINGVADYFKEQGREVVLTREPGGSRLGKSLRAILLDVANDDLTSEAELFLYLADRSQHISQVVRPALEAGAVVLCDRFADSTVVYQGYGRGLDPLELHSLNKIAVAGTWPELTFLLDLPPEVGLKRAFMRNVREQTTESEGRFEAESLDFHTRIRDGYLTWADKHQNRFRIVKADAAPEDVLAGVLNHLSSHSSV